MARKCTAVVSVVCLVIAASPLLARAYGPEGHLIASAVAEPRLCAAARSELAALGDGQSLADLGLWADRVRREYPESAPWHYMNIPDGADVRAFRHPPEGDVLEAIARFRQVLGDRSRPKAERAAALKYLAHFIVDIHQPLHVGRESDRGGNTIEFPLGRATTNLHRFWDSDVIELTNLSVSRYARSLRARLEAAVEAGAELDPAVWAEESLALRGVVYAFERGAGALDAAYIERAQSITRDRLALAGLRLAASLNDVLCR
jgi:hypothetical protein